MPFDGGVVALSGFLYQAWVVGGLLAKSQVLEEDDSHLDALVSLTKNAQLQFERFDQDIVLSPTADVFDHGIVLVQLKYSAEGLNATDITAYEMRTKVIAAFIRAKQAAIAAGEAIAGYWLITNRAVTAVPQMDWTPEEQEIFELMIPTPDAQIEKWKSALVTYARKFGSNDDDIERGRNELFGLILNSSQPPRNTCNITPEDLLRCMGRSPFARSLTRADLRGLIGTDLSHFHADIVRTPVRRELMNQAAIDAGQRALIVFEGEGGYGKTASLYQWATEINAAPAPALPLVALETASLLVPDWIQWLVRRWNPGRIPIDEADAINRLRTANQANLPPILHLSLDGVDDRITNPIVTQSVKQLVQHFADLDEEAQLSGQPPQVRLVITCRSYDQFRRKTLAGSRSGGRTGDAPQPALYRFDRFSDAELRRLVHDNFDQLYDEVFGQLPAAPAPTHAFVTASTGSLTFEPPWPSSAFPTDAWGEVPQTLRTAVVPNVQRNYSEILKDPVMWRAFCELNDAQRVAWLRGDNTIDLLLGGSYVDRFAQKAAERMNYTPDEIVAALRRVGAADGAALLVYRNTGDWIDRCCAGNAMNRDEARALKLEARSGGVTVEDTPERWQWRNTFVAAYLSNGETEP